ncbi:MAG: glycoside hydrolase family 18 protein [Planctomycetota bacterium]
MTHTLRAVLCLLALAAPTHAAERVLVGYYATFGNLPVEQMPWDRLTHVSHAFLRLDAEGAIVTTEAVPNAALTADGRANNTPVLLCVGGGVTVRGLEAATKTDGAASALASKIVEAAVAGRYAGVDLHWEFPRDESTGAAHARLLSALRRRLDAAAAAGDLPKQPILTAAVSPSDFLGQWIDAAEVAKTVDWLTVVAYDLSGPWSLHAGHHAPLLASPDDPEGDSRSVAASMRYWAVERGVPAEKLVLAAPLFGRLMPVAEPYAELDPDLADRHRLLPFAEVRKLAGEGWRAEWDNASRAPWLRSPASADEPANSPAGPALTPIDPDAEAHENAAVIVSYDDRNSIHLKATWAREQGCRGMAFWAVHQDRMPDGRHWLIDAAYRAWPAE